MLINFMQNYGMKSKCQNVSKTLETIFCMFSSQKLLGSKFTITEGKNSWSEEKLFDDYGSIGSFEMDFRNGEVFFRTRYVNFDLMNVSYL